MHVIFKKKFWRGSAVTTLAHPQWEGTCSSGACGPSVLVPLMLDLFISLSNTSVPPLNRLEDQYTNSLLCCVQLRLLHVAVVV